MTHIFWPKRKDFKKLLLPVQVYFRGEHKKKKNINCDILEPIIGKVRENAMSLRTEAYS